MLLESARWLQHGLPTSFKLDSRNFKAGQAVCTGLVKPVFPCGPWQLDGYCSSFCTSASVNSLVTLCLADPQGHDVAFTTPQLVIRIPESLINVKARPLPGWSIKYTGKRLQKAANLYGSKLTTTIDTITYTAGKNQALADNQVQLVDIFFNVRKTAELGTLPGKYKLDGKYGPNGWRPAYIPVTQVCGHCGSPRLPSVVCVTYLYIRCSVLLVCLHVTL